MGLALASWRELLGRAGPHLSLRKTTNLLTAVVTRSPQAFSWSLQDRWLGVSAVISITGPRSSMQTSCPTQPPAYPYRPSTTRFFQQCINPPLKFLIDLCKSPSASGSSENMDVDRTGFWPKLPSILGAISESQFVSVDLEMSGIIVESVESTPNPTLQQIYQDARAAAETFTILQFGLTCVRWEYEKGAYVTKTYNLPVHPGFVGSDIASKQLARTIDRRVEFSSKTIAFLQEHGFSFAQVFNKGVPYLSTTEAAQKGIVDFVQNSDKDEDHIVLANFHRSHESSTAVYRQKSESGQTGGYMKPKPSH